jgi:hypothetical protein
MVSFKGGHFPKNYDPDGRALVCGVSLVELCISHRAIARLPPRPALSPSGGEDTGEGDGSEWFLLVMQNSIRGYW